MFIKQCDTAIGKESIDIPANEQIKWLKTIFKTNDCINLEKQIKEVNSFTKIIPLQIFKRTERREYPFKPFEFENTQISFDSFSDSWIKAEKNFYDLKIFKEFKNITHFFYENDISEGRNICDTIEQVPSINSVSISSNFRLGEEDIECILKLNIKLYLIGTVRLNDLPEKLKNNIYGIENFLGEVRSLNNFKRLEYLGFKNFSKDSSLKELVNIRNLSNLYLNIKNVKAIEDIRYLRNLKYLTLNCIEDNKYLITTNHDEIRCKGKALEDIRFLSNLILLKGLDLSWNRIKDFSPIKQMKNLELLNLSSNEIEDIPKETNLQKLRFLNLYSNKIKEIFEVSQYPNLVFLNLSHNQIFQIKNLSKLSRLKFLAVGNNPILDFNSFLPPGDLIVLNLDFNYTERISKLNQILASSSISKVTQDETEQIWIQNMTFGDYSRLQIPDEKTSKQMFEDFDAKKFRNIKLLSINGIYFKNTPEFEKMANLKYLDFSYVKIQNLSSIHFPKEILHLNLRRNDGILETNFSNLGKLEILDIGDNHISENEIKLSLPALKTLIMDKCELTYLPNLSQTPRITYLDLQKNLITTFSNIDLKELNLLDLSYNHLGNIPDFSGLPGITDVFLNNNEIDRIEMDTSPQIRFSLNGNPLNTKDENSCPKKIQNKSIKEFCQSM